MLRQLAGQEDAGGELAANVARVLDTLGTLGATLIAAQPDGTQFRSAPSFFFAYELQVTGDSR